MLNKHLSAFPPMVSLVAGVALFALFILLIAPLMLQGGGWALLLIGGGLCLVFGVVYLKIIYTAFIASSRVRPAGNQEHTEF